MIVLLAESKRMSRVQMPVRAGEYVGHRPEYDREAGALMEMMSHWSHPELAARLRISGGLAREMWEYVRDFADKSQGFKAISGFVGVAFKALDWDTIEPDARAWAESRLLVVSSLYGLLRPYDIIKPYRLDYAVRVSLDGSADAASYNALNTMSLVKRLQQTGETEVLDLMPADASRTFDWKLIRSFARVYAPDFKVIADASSIPVSDEGTLPAGALTTPPATRLKQLRGLMARHVATARTGSFAALEECVSAEWCRIPGMSSKGRPVFLTD